MPLLVLGLLAALLWPLVGPSVQRAWRTADLLRQPAPTALPNPLPGTTFTDTWGAARGQGRTHEGVDIFAPRGTPILSTTPGVLLRNGENGLGGLYAMVLGPGGQRHYYAHLSAYGPHQPGDWLEAGDVVGFVGNTGNARTTPPHLHYGIYTAGGAINPYPLLR